MRRPAASWTLAALAIGFGVARLVLVIADSGGPGKIAGVATPESHPALAVYETIALALFAATGALVASRRSRNPIGWLLLTTPFWLGVGLVSERLAWHGLLSHGTLGHGVTDWLWVANWAWIPAVVPVFTLVPLLFPTGRPLTQRWRRVGWVTVAAACALLVAYALSPGSLENYPAVENPFSVGRAARPIVGVAYALVAAGALASAVSLALRFRRSRTARSSTACSPRR